MIVSLRPMNPVTKVCKLCNLGDLFAGKRQGYAVDTLYHVVHEYCSSMSRDFFINCVNEEVSRPFYEKRLFAAVYSDLNEGNVSKVGLTGYGVKKYQASCFVLESEIVAAWRKLYEPTGGTCYGHARYR